MLKAPLGQLFPTADVEIYRPEDFDKPMAEGVSIHLYRVTRTGGAVNPVSRCDSNGQRFNPSLLLDLHYLITPWAATAETQHSILGKAIRLLEDASTLNSGLLNHTFPAFSDDESVQLIGEPLSLADIGSIWESFKPNVQLSVGYVAQMVAIDSDIEQRESPIVQTRMFDYAASVE